MALAQVLGEPLSIVGADVDLVELYFDRGWTDGLPVVALRTTRSMPSCRPSAAIQAS